MFRANEKEAMAFSLRRMSAQAGKYPEDTDAQTVKALLDEAVAKLEGTETGGIVAGITAGSNAQIGAVQK